ncbi:hypothetical protein SEUCBS139899_000743 [Sporothrix eucalyptigena]|uniref:Uncharacterized protein n=1 Tax=Sporothrix eucalyptigena TaxID=1812306 RepID=A0ABP0AV01_9PEZI
MTTTASAGDSSLFSRIAQSAAGLSRDFVSARQRGSDIASLASTDKAGPSSRAQPSAPAAAGEGSAASIPTWTGASGGSSHAQQHATAQDAAFASFLDGADIDMSMPTEPIIGLDDDNSTDAWSMPAPHQTQPTSSQSNPLLQQPSSAVTEQESRDGLDVVNLLSADGPAEEEPNYGDIELAEDEIEALKRALFGENSDNNAPSAGNREWDNVLNFIPDFVRPNPLGGYENEQSNALFSTGAPVKSNETQATMGMAHSSESTRQWLDQWHDVLTRYDDEVWGGLSPLVEQAREEVDQLQQSEPAQIAAGTKALDRLRQILGHLRD